MLTSWVRTILAAAPALGRRGRPLMGLPIPVSTLPVAVTLQGAPSLSEPLGAALRAQWAFGFPRVPKPLAQLTHGFLHYPAGMQPVAAMHLLEVLPRGTLLDPFVGGGTSMIEALRSGRTCIGADASPLALFASSHHTWLACDEELLDLRMQATQVLRRVDAGYVGVGEPRDGGEDEAEAAEGPSITTQERRSPPRLERNGRGRTTFKSWTPLKGELERLLAEPSVNSDATGEADAHEVLSPLWFCFAAAQQRSERFRFSNPLASFDATVDEYCDALRALRTHVPAPTSGLLSGTVTSSTVTSSTGRGSASGGAKLLLCDARVLSLAEQGLPPADAVLTSPPYAGVYDYLSHARETRVRVGAGGDAPVMGLRGVPEGRSWPTDWRSENEMGARKALRKTREAGAFTQMWEEDQRAWLGATKSNLRAGGRAAIMVGDGEGSIDALLSTAKAADDVGLKLLASATITSTLDQRSQRHKGRRRPEHILLLEAP